MSKKNKFNDDTVELAVPEAVTEVKQTPVTTPDLPLCPLEVFCRLSGRKADQIAGFKRYAQNQGYRTATIPEWRAKLAEFDTRPTK